MKKLILLVILATGCLKDSQSLNSFSDRQNDKLLPYLYMFVADAREHGIDLDYVMRGEIELRFMRSDVYGKSWAWRNDNKVKVWVNYDKWIKMSEIHKITLMYHELGHDVLGLDHHDGPVVMLQSNDRIDTMKERGISYEEAFNELFNYYKNK